MGERRQDGSLQRSLSVASVYRATGVTFRDRRDAGLTQPWLPSSDGSTSWATRTTKVVTFLCPSDQQAGKLVKLGSGHNHDGRPTNIVYCMADSIARIDNSNDSTHDVKASNGNTYLTSKTAGDGNLSH